MTPVEELVAQLWAEELDIDKAALHPRSDFFDVGGHSFAAASIQHGIALHLDVEVPLMSVLELPILHEFALHVERLRN